jgi:hypothetical protein
LNLYLKRFAAQVRFNIAKIPHQVMHHTLRHDAIRKPLVKFIGNFPIIDRVLRSVFVRSQQRIAQERIIFQRYSHPNLVMKKNRKAALIDPRDLALQNTKPYSLEQILDNIQKELS